jgi:hypothetical protein
MNLLLLEPPPGERRTLDAGVSKYYVYAYELHGNWRDIGSELNEWATLIPAKTSKELWLFAVCGTAYL